MEDIVKHPIVILVALALVGASSLVNLKLSTDPAARPDSFTGSDARELEALLEGQIQENRDDIDTIRERYNKHVEWGKERAGDWEARIKSLERGCK